jgi:hypothetical protein
MSCPIVSEEWPWGEPNSLTIEPRAPEAGKAGLGRGASGHRSQSDEFTGGWVLAKLLKLRCVHMSRFRCF